MSTIKGAYPTNSNVGVIEIFRLAAKASHAFSATGGKHPISYSVASGSGSVESANGTYTAASDAGIATVRATDALGDWSETSITIAALLVLSPSVASVSTLGQIQFAATGGVLPYTYSLLSGGGSISEAGMFSAGAATGVSKILVTDALNQRAQSAVIVE